MIRKCIYDILEFIHPRARKPYVKPVIAQNVILKSYLNDNVLRKSVKYVTVFLVMSFFAIFLLKVSLKKSCNFWQWQLHHVLTKK